MAQPIIKPCGACKHLRRKCSDECVFAPYFPPDNIRKFQIVHKFYGASNISKLLKELSATDRDDAVRSLVYEAECLLKNPVYGCVADISILQQTLRDMRSLLINAKKELASYIRPPQPMLPILQPPDFMGQRQPLGMIPQHQGPSGMLSRQQGPSDMVPQQQGPSGMIGQERQVIMIPDEQHMGNPSTPKFAYNLPRLGILEQQGPSEMLSQQQGPSGTVPQQQGLSGMIGQERHVIMIPEEQHMSNPSTPMFAYNIPRLGMHAPAMTSHESQLMIHEAQQILQQKEDEELQQRVFESQQQLAAVNAQREQLIMMNYEQQKQMQLELWRLNSTFKYNMRWGCDGFNDDNPNLQPNHQYFSQELDQHYSPDPIRQFEPQQPEQHPTIDSCRVLLPQEPMALRRYGDNFDYFQPQQPEQQPPSDPHYQFFSQVSEKHHSPDLIHQFMQQQPEQHPPSNSYPMLLPQEPMALGTHNDNPYHFQTQQPELQPPSDPYHFFAQDPDPHHFLDHIHQTPENHHFPDASHHFLPQEFDIHPFRGSNFQFETQQPQQHHHPDPDPYHQILPQHQHHPHPHDLQTELFFQPLQSQPLQQIPQLQQPQQQQQEQQPESDQDSKDLPP